MKSQALFNVYEIAQTLRQRNIAKGSQYKYPGVHPGFFFVADLTCATLPCVSLSCRSGGLKISMISLRLLLSIVGLRGVTQKSILG